MNEITRIITPCRCGKCIYCELGGNPPAQIIEKETVCGECEHKSALIEQMREALQWYKEQVSSCNRNGDAGELARDRLAKDIGKRAEAALAAERGSYV